jgi:long-subunit fatty acid transport protein
MKIFYKIIPLLVIASGFLYAQSNNGFVLLKMDVDARAAAMAGAYTALPNDASAAFWNPAGLASAEKSSINAMYNDWLFNISHSFAAVQFVQGEHNLAISFNYFKLPGIQIRSRATDNPDGVIDAFNLVAAVSYARTYDQVWQVGMSVKYLFEKYYLTSAPGFAADFGVLRKNMWSNMDFGFTVRNIGKMSKLDKKATPLPVMVNLGLAWRVPEFFDNKLLLAPDIQWIDKEQFYFRFGVEYNLIESLTLRTGLKSGNDETLWTAGIGINYNSFHLDYAYAPLGFKLGSSNRISIGMDF